MTSYSRLRGYATNTNNRRSSKIDASVFAPQVLDILQADDAILQQSLTNTANVFMN